MDSDYNGATCFPPIEKSNRGTRGPREKKYKVSSNTGFKGIIYQPRGKNHYHAQMTCRIPKSQKMIRVHIGTYATAEEANDARIKFITKIL